MLDTIIDDRPRDGWEIAQARPRVFSLKIKRPYVSLNTRGEIAMNAFAFKQIDEAASVTLLYDAANRTVGIKIPEMLDDNFFPVRHYGRGKKMRIIRAARLLRQFDIKVERTMVFRGVETQKWNGKPMLVLHLDKAVEVTLKRGRRT